MIDETTPEEVLDMKIEAFEEYLSALKERKESSLVDFMKEIFGWEESTTKNYLLKHCKI